MYMKKAVNQGFTLVEMLVAITVFAVVTLIATGSVLKISDAYRRAQALEGVMNNLNFALETMTREIRTGINYRCEDNTLSITSFSEVPRDCVQGRSPEVGNTLVFLPSNDTEEVAYQFMNPADGIGYIQYCRQNAPSIECTRLTSPNVDIEYMKLYVDGSQAGEGRQPTAVMSIKGAVTLGGQRSSTFNLQTTMVQRVLDN